ncbi:putative CC-NBS resistance protein [Senna tora]|uniref:Putative CC-NBS resistance protein n=1 Tax=Senna tora TaxID=362788 RepID=A0A834TZN9_9FABA|nr:putative CC-NBS resistance protein [Senna tora]
MVLCFPSTPKKLAMSIACFLSGASILAVGVHLSYVNVAPQQARTKARNDFVKEALKKKYGYTPPEQARTRVIDGDFTCIPSVIRAILKYCP